MAWYSEPKELKKKPKKDLWIKCKKCLSHIYISEWDENLNVCPNCNYHGSITSHERINLLLDKNTFKELFNNIIMCYNINIMRLRNT